MLRLPALLLVALLPVAASSAERLPSRPVRATNSTKVNAMPSASAGLTIVKNATCTFCG